MAKFEVTARTLLHLGSELITSDEVALYELIKNAFDAGSSRVSIHFFVPVEQNTLKECIKEISSFDEHNQKFEVLKKNILKRLKEGWTLLDNLGKPIEFEKQTNQILESINIPSLMKSCSILNRIEVEDSGSGMDATNLIDAFLKIGTSYKNTHSSKEDGTPVLGNKGIGRLSMMRLGGSSLVETWSAKDENTYKIEFNWSDFDSSDLLLDQINFPLIIDVGKKNVSGTKISIYSLTSNWYKERIDNEIVDRFLRRLNNPFEKDSKRFPVDLYLNNSKRFPIKQIDNKLLELADRDFVMNFFPENATADSSEILKSTIEIPGRKDSMVPQSRTVRDMKNKFDCSIDDLKSLGPFTLKIKWYNRAKLAKKGLGSDLKKYRDELDLWNGGIAIYRDGFRIGLSGSSKDGDWLGIDNQAFRGRGFTLNRIQTVGALEISKNDNPKLIDRSNREGLIDSDMFDLLRNIIQKFALTELRNHAQSEEKIQQKELENQLLDDGINSIELRLYESEKIIHEIQNLSPNAKKQVTSLHQNMQFITNSVKQFKTAITELQERREDILELAGVGNVMRSIMHELNRTTSQTRTLLNKVAEKADAETADLLKKLESEIKSLNIRLSQLDPLSTSGRNRKGDFDLIGLINTIISGYKSRFERHNIDFLLTLNDAPVNKEKLIVKMVKGFVSLTLENLILNSIYWLKTGNYLAGHDKSKIYINIDSLTNVIEVYDNGPGISPTDKDRIFNPGFSLRKDGGGYGLYIAKEVSFNYGSNIYLDANPFEDGRLRRFVIELPKGDEK
ncbi:ATP-binding protein [Sodalis sp. RH14]|uniref:ATP-binding protein n=1 Tax=Sodalis sp. RH14 TaxID=3394329 RepID=UPI0039B59A5C